MIFGDNNHFNLFVFSPVRYEYKAYSLYVFVLHFHVGSNIEMISFSILNVRLMFHEISKLH